MGCTFQLFNPLMAYVLWRQLYSGLSGNPVACDLNQIWQELLVIHKIYILPGKSKHFRVSVAEPGAKTKSHFILSCRNLLLYSFVEPLLNEDNTDFLGLLRWAENRCQQHHLLIRVADAGVQDSV